MSRFGVVFSAVLICSFWGLNCGDDATSVSSERPSAGSENSFDVGASATLEVVNFAGMVEVFVGEPGVVEVAVERKAGTEEDLELIEVDMVGDEDNVRITTANPSSLQQASVDLEITVPPDMRPSVQNGAGSVLYQGPAAGECIFSTGAGSITLKLPADVNVEVYLSVGAGSITVDFPVDGQVSTHVVEGTIGTGADGSVDARVGAGTIAVQRQ